MPTHFDILQKDLLCPRETENAKLLSYIVMTLRYNEHIGR